MGFILTLFAVASVSPRPRNGKKITDNSCRVLSLTSKMGMLSIFMAVTFSFGKQWRWPLRVKSEQDHFVTWAIG